MAAISLPANNSSFTSSAAGSAARQGIDLPGMLDLLAHGAISARQDIPWGSNYTFLVQIEKAPFRTLAIYKPQRGEAPLWDFRAGTLCYREYVAYLLSAALDWWLVPPTVLRDGPFGLGMAQLYVDADPNESYFDLRDDQFSDQLMRIAAFDVLTNNADRKGGHVLRDRGTNRLWAIDHGLTFHTEYKLRTVIWDFAGQPLPAAIVSDCRHLLSQLQKGEPLSAELGKLMSPGELNALRRRTEALLANPVFPSQNPSYRNIPWPPV